MAMAALSIVFSLFLCFLIGVDSIVWKPCTDAQKGKVTDVRIKGCEHDPVCALKKGQNASVEIDFVTYEDAKAVKAVVHGILAGVPVPFPLDNPDGCKDSGLQCPLKNGTKYTYATQIFVKSTFPAIKLTVKWELKDESSNDIVCILTPVEIVDAKNRL